MEKNEGQSSIRIRILIVVATLLALVIALAALAYANANRIVAQNSAYLETTAIQTAQQVNGLFEDSLRDIQTTAEVFEESLTSPDVDPTEAADVLSLPQFDHTFFITPRGMAYKPDGTTGVATEKHYYTQGIQGVSGICYIADALFDGESVIAFFAPVQYEDRVAGVLVCAYRESTVARYMNAAFSGQQMPTYLCEADGRIIAVSIPEGSLNAKYMDDVFADATFEGTSLDQVNGAIGSGTPISFTYRASGQTTIAQVARLASFDWAIVRLFPANATSAMVEEATMVNGTISICVFAIASIATALLLVQSRKQKRVKVPGTLTHSEEPAGSAEAEERAKEATEAKEATGARGAKTSSTLAHPAPNRVESIFASSLTKDIQTPAQLAKDTSDEMDPEEAARLDAERVLREKEGLRDLGYQGKRILLTEDNAMATSIAQELLELTGAEVEHADNGKAALKMLLDNEPGYYDIVLMDIQMPVMNGYDATRAIRESAAQRPDLATLPVIALSADMFADDVRSSQEAGMNDHIAKPLQASALVEVLRKWTDES